MNGCARVAKSRDRDKPRPVSDLVEWDESSQGEPEANTVCLQGARDG